MKSFDDGMLVEWCSMVMVSCYFISLDDDSRVTRTSRRQSFIPLVLCEPLPMRAYLSYIFLAHHSVTIFFQGCSTCSTSKVPRWFWNLELSITVDPLPH